VARLADGISHGRVIEAQYLWERRSDGRYVPKVQIRIPRQQGQMETLVITDPQGRTYRDLNKALEMDFWMLNQWRMKHAPKADLVITPA
jgi:hypothetical protein